MQEKTAKSKKKNIAANQKSGKIVKYERSMLQMSERDMYWIDHYAEYAYVANENKAKNAKCFVWQDVFLSFSLIFVPFCFPKKKNFSTQMNTKITDKWPRIILKTFRIFHCSTQKEIAASNSLSVE